MNSQTFIAIITSAGAASVLTGVVAYLKDRKKDAATAKLTDVQALQQQVALMEQVTKFLRTENEQLQKDYQQSEDARRRDRQQMLEVEYELQKVKQKAAETQLKCEALSNQLQQLAAGKRDDNPRSQP